MFPLEKNLASLIAELPDPEEARLFLSRVSAEQPAVAKTLARDEGLLADALALASWSPLLGTTLAQHPAYLPWLARERVETRVRTHDELMESLARFALTNSQLDPQTLLARFRRRDLLRIYLKDIRGTATVVEITEELSNLADAVLDYGLGIASQEMNNLYGPPLGIGERGRTHAARICVMGLGKLGSYELNYASDIDIQFLFSEDGATTGTGTRESLTNREYFVKLAALLSRIVGQSGGEAAAYRVDWLLRPQGRDGALACSLAEAVRYYRETAHPWELQTLIRARASAGSAAIYARFAEALRDRVYRRDETIGRALAHVRLAKRKIDRHHAQSHGFNVKLGRGGIREIEFIAQALQLAYGGADVWLQAPHTLISLGRLSDRSIISEREYTNLSEAYAFLRKLEHRLQMDQGLQTHALPDELRRRALIARRMHFSGSAALMAFDRALEAHTESVHATFGRVFGEVKENEIAARHASAPTPRSFVAAEAVAAQAPDEIVSPVSEDAATATFENISAIFSKHLARAGGSEMAENASFSKQLRAAVNRSLNPQRALGGAERIAFSLAKLQAPPSPTGEQLIALIELCGTSEYFTEVMVSNPSLIEALPLPHTPHTPHTDYESIMREAVLREDGFGAEMAALRRAWAKLLIETAARDAANVISIYDSNARQSVLAVASISVACLIAQRQLARNFGERVTAGAPHLAVLGLGRLSGCGLDYGSDLDLILIYDDERALPGGTPSREELMARSTELFVSALSSMTREGQLYRVDLRLRPDGKNGALAVPARAFLNYAEDRTAIWEWLAYVKLRAVGGDVALGRSVEEKARAIIHRKASKEATAEQLLGETRRVRERLEHERRRGGGQAIDIKYGAGGMLDVYFAVRFLQLRDNIPDRDADRSTKSTIERLRGEGSLTESDYTALKEGYALLRTVDHYVRLIVGRSTRLQSLDHPAMRDIARRVGFDSSITLTETLVARMREIRVAYERIVS
ncbi:MAG: hypothetical protein WKF30_05710 [Pyrinomonadaceae bacterium]